ncbi:MAG: helix-turn-helix domain-containing protein [Alkalispirochaetaceae bacterium]
MESIGAKLQGSRSSKGYSVEQVARETHIAKRFIEALEAEDFDAFPGEPYILGFLRTYAYFLDLDGDELVTLYRNTQLQESPPPMEELLDSRRRPSWIKIAIVVGLVLIVGAGIAIAFASGLFAESPAEQEPVAAPLEEEEPEEQIVTSSITLTDEFLEQRFQEGTRLDIPVSGTTYPLTIAAINEGVTLRTPSSLELVTPGQEENFDMSGDGVADVRVVVRDITRGDSPTVVMRVDRVVSSPSGSSERSDRAIGNASETPVVGNSSEPDRLDPTTVVAEFEEEQEYIVEIEFRGYTLFRYLINGEDRSEQYMQSGDVFRTSVDGEILLWFSNAGSARVRAAGREVPFGEAGEVAIGILRWNDDPATGEAQLEKIPVY